MNRKKVYTHTWLIKSHTSHHSEVSKYNLNFGFIVNLTIKQCCSILFFISVDLYSKHMKVN